MFDLFAIYMVYLVDKWEPIYQFPEWSDIFGKSYDIKFYMV